MADVTLSTPALVTTMGNNRYILGDADSGRASQFAIQIDLNGGAATYAFYVRVSPETAWAAAMAYPVSTPTTGATSGTTSNVWMLCPCPRIRVAFGPRMAMLARWLL